MQDSGRHLLAYDGWKMLFFLAVLALVSTVYIGWIAGLLLFLVLTVLGYIFRNPQRTIPSAPLAVVSPASGEINAIETVEDQWLSRTAIRFSMKISLWDIHILRSPAEGKVIKQWVAEEKNLQGYNRRYTYWIKTDEDDDVIFSILLGRWSSFTRVYFLTGDRLGQGQTCGFLYWTGAIEILMPANARINIKAGDRMESGSSILGSFVHEEGSSVIGNS